MENKHYTALELDKVLALLAAETTSEGSRARALAIVPSADCSEVNRMMAETSAVSSLTTRFSTPSLGGLSDCTALLNKARIGARLSIPELLAVCRLLRTVRQIKDWRKQCEDKTVVDGLFEALSPCRALEEDIGNAVLNDEELADSASTELASIRRKITRAQLGIRERLDKMIRSKQYENVLQEQLVTLRDGRFVVPVRAECKGQVQGLIHDTSSTGATVFIEPMAVVEANNEIRMLQSEEQQEIDRILLEFSGRVGQIADSALISYDALLDLDVLFAKSRLADRQKAAVPEINDTGVIDLKKARHPLIDPHKVVPVDVMLGERFDTLVITGPNTGGKTVALKTLGLLTLMAACGLMIPAAAGSRVAVFSHVLADIGDEQSIEQSLSTFSAHIKNIISILDVADSGSLVLTDELGAGTDPVEGAALAVAIIEALRRKGARLAATTHYAEIKMYALTTEGVENGCCEFDVATLSPTYRLLIGVPGRSNAFAISQRLGLPETVIDRAKELVSTDNARFEDVVSGLESTRQELESEKSTAERERERAEQLRRDIAAMKAQAKREADAELARARDAAKGLVERTRSQTDMLLSELEELKKQKDKAEFSGKVAAMSQGYNSRIGKLRDDADPVQAAESDAGYKLPRALKPGDTVLIADIGTEGIVVSGPDNAKNYMVQAGIMKTKVQEDRLRLLENAKRATFTPAHRQGGGSKLSREGSTELDLRGMMSDEAIMELDRFIDRCLLSGIRQITVIHGKGTGALRTAVQQHLRRHSAVKSQRPGMYGEGEAGVTVAELK